MVRPRSGRSQARPQLGVLAGVSRNSHIWHITQAISPRAHVQVAKALDDGSPAPDNSYPDRANIAGPCPDLPWVVHLADEDRLYRLLAFDFDAHHASAEAAQRDAYHFVALLERLGSLPYLVCESGPSGGLHVWLAPSDGLPATTVATVARIAARLYPTLDIAPLTNAATGGVRPPGSPHRHGGHSTILYGDVDTLIHPSSTTEAIHRLLSELDQLAPPAESTAGGDGLAIVDARGRLYLPGTRSSLGPTATAALHGPVDANADASAVLFSSLLGAARARWRFDDIHALLDTAPGLEYARTERHGRTRLPRTHGEQHRLLARHWDRAVRHAASTRLQGRGTSNPELTERAETVTAVVAAAIEHMNASPGRWSQLPELLYEAPVGRDGVPTRSAKDASHRRPTDRLVLLELYQRALDGLTITVRASVRTLAMSLPIGRESVRESLQRLAAEGWIALDTPTEGATAASWSIDPSSVFHREALRSRSATGLAPVGATPQETWRSRSTLQLHLRSLTDNANHDVFMPRALGPDAGYVYAGAVAQPGLTTKELALTLNSPTPAVSLELAALSSAGLVRSVGGAWTASDPNRRDRAAVLLGVVGLLDQRRYRYRIEQATWAYWLAELAATSLPTVLSSGPLRVVALPSGVTTTLGAYPRTTRFRGSWSDARARIEAVMVA